MSESTKNNPALLASRYLNRKIYLSLNHNLGYNILLLNNSVAINHAGGSLLGTLKYTMLSYVPVMFITSISVRYDGRLKIEKWLYCGGSGDGSFPNHLSAATLNSHTYFYKIRYWDRYIMTDVSHAHVFQIW